MIARRLTLVLVGLLTCLMGAVAPGWAVAPTVTDDVTILALPGNAPKTPASAAGKSVTVGAQPATAKGYDQRPWFLVGATPGGSFEDHVAFVNYSSNPAQISVYPQDALSTESGAFTVAPADAPKKDAGAWIKLALQDRSLTIPARSQAIVPITVKVPANATPGDHSAGIVASVTGLAKNDAGDQIKIDQRVATRVYLRVSGELKPRLEVTDLKVNYSGTINPIGKGKAQLTYRITNVGNVRLGAKHSARITGLLGTSVKVPELADIPEILPGSSVLITAPSVEIRPMARHTARVTVSGFSAPGAADPDVTSIVSSKSFWAVPWVLMALLLTVIAAAFGQRSRRRQRRTLARSRSRSHRNNTSGAASVGVVALLAAAVLVVPTPGPARAESIGDLTALPAAGKDTTPMQLQTSGVCPADVPNVQAFVKGPGFPAAGRSVVGNSRSEIYPRAATGGMILDLALTLRDFMAREDRPVLPLKGKYSFTVTCRAKVNPASHGDFTTTVAFNDKGEYVAVSPQTVPASPSTPTSVTSNATPTSSAATISSSPQTSPTNPPSSEPTQGVSVKVGEKRSTQSSVLLITAIALGVLALFMFIGRAIRRRRIISKGNQS